MTKLTQKGCHLIGDKQEAAFQPVEAEAVHAPIWPLPGQRRWLELLSDYDAKFFITLGKANVDSDCLSRKNENPKGS
ncbi:hypothetical protein Tco_1249210 [Tanacetum coccineum]